MLKTVKIPKQFEPIFEKAQEYVSRYFEGKKEDPSKGTIEIFGERYILVRAASMSVDFFETVTKLYEKEGQEEALNIARQRLSGMYHECGIFFRMVRGELWYNIGCFGNYVPGKGRSRLPLYHGPAVKD
jgi:hypothetical protein